MHLSNAARDVEAFVFGIQILCSCPSTALLAPVRPPHWPCCDCPLCSAFSLIGKTESLYTQDRELFKTYYHDYNVNFSELSWTWNWTSGIDFMCEMSIECLFNQLLWTHQRTHFVNTFSSDADICLHIQYVCKPPSGSKCDLVKKWLQDTVELPASLIFFSSDFSENQS